jgi:DNA polymerase-3 subunit gamma/tau
MFDEDDSDPALFAEPKADSGYLVLARKYRPRTFEDLVGQDAMVRTIANSFALNRIPHAYVLTGVRGIGKTTTARLLARALNYKGATIDRPSVELDPPGIHCREIMESRHPDVFEMDAASRTGINDIREILDSVRYAPVSARTKVYIIDEVHMLSTAAFNGLLKTLEEPPPHVKFIFATTEIRKVPVTVLSRCQRFDLKRIPADRLAEHLAAICAREKVQVEPDGIALIARAAEGSVRDGLSLLDQAIVQKGGEIVSAALIREMLGLADRLRIADLFEAMLQGDARLALLELRNQYEAGADPSLVVRDMLELAHEAARVQALGAEARIVGGDDWAARIRGFATKSSPAQLSRLWQMTLKALEEVSKAPDPLAAAEMALVRLCAAASLPPPEDLARLLRGAAPLNLAAAPAMAPAPASSGAGAPPVLNSFEEMVQLIDAQRDVDLQVAVEKYVRVASFASGRLVFAPAPGAPADLASRIERRLTDWTGQTWEVRADAASGVESLTERRAMEHQAQVDELKQHPFVAEALAAFPGAEIKTWGKPDAAKKSAEIVSLSKRPKRKET